MANAKNTINDFLQLKDIDIKVRKGEFICIIGDVGSGKSSIFSAINGDMMYVPFDMVE